MDLDKLLVGMPERTRRGGADVGDLPCEAVIGMTYTPMQRCGSEKYEPMAALSRGTLFPGLELPWFNNYNVRHVAKTPLGEMQALDFCIVELSLYLDTHPGDREAVEMLQAYRKAYKDVRKAYVRRYGPVSKSDVTETNEYEWINDPWPWEIGAARRDCNV